MNTKRLLLLLVLLWVTSPVVGQAAELTLSPTVERYTQDETFTAKLSMDKADTSNGVVRTTLTFDPSQLSVLAVNLAGPPLSCWLSDSFFSNETGIIEIMSRQYSKPDSSAPLAEVTFQAHTDGKLFLQMSTSTQLAGVADGISLIQGSIGTDRNYVEEEVVVTSPTEEPRATDFLLILATFTLGLLLVVLALYAWYLKRLMGQKEGLLRQETLEVREKIGKVFGALQAEVKDQIDSLTKHKRSSAREKETAEALTQALEVSKQLLGKEIDDVNKVLD